MLRFSMSVFLAAIGTLMVATFPDAKADEPTSAELQQATKEGRVVVLQKGNLKTDIVGYEDIGILNMRLVNKEGRVVNGTDIRETFRPNKLIRIMLEGKRVIEVQALN